MAMNFPNAPTVGQLYPLPAVAGSPQYKWDGEKWVNTAGTDTGKIVIYADGSNAMTAPLRSSKAASGQSAQIIGQLGSLNRWSVVLGDTSTEAGSNAGSHFAVYRYDDTGAYVDPPLWINRQDGTVNLPSGNLKIAGTAGMWPGVYINKAASGVGCAVTGQTNGLARWQMLLGDQTAESGSNAGSDFILARYSDAGAYIDTPFTLSRSNSALRLRSSGGFTISASASSLIYLTKDASGNAAQIFGQTNAKHRWSIELGNSSAEGGSNTGSLFSISRYNDAGTYVDSPITIARDSGRAVLVNPTDLSGGFYSGNFYTGGIMKLGWDASSGYIRMAFNSTNVPIAYGQEASGYTPFRDWGLFGANAVVFAAWPGGNYCHWNIIWSRKATTDVQPAPDGALDLLNAIPVTSSTFDFNKPEGEERIEKWAYSVTSHAVATALPYARDAGDDPDLDPGKVIPFLIKAVQELSARNAALEARVAALGG